MEPNLFSRKKGLKVLFVVYHPVDPNIVFETARKIENNGGETFFVIIEKEGIINNLVKSNGFRGKVIGESKVSFLGKVLNTFSIVYKIINIIKKFNPNVVFSPVAPYTSFACRFNKVPLVCWEDTETANFNWKYANKRIDSILLVKSYYKDRQNDNIIRFNGYKELAYLHPNVFYADESILRKIGLSKSDKIVLLRFSAMHAMHDIGIESEVLSNEDKILKFIQKIETTYNAKVLISMSERDLGERFSKYKLSIPPSKYLDLLAFCTLYIGEGTTTACEAGVLGVPWIALRDKPLGYLNDQEENYNLGFRIDNIDNALQKAEEFLKKDYRSEWKIKREKLLNDKIDVSAFLTWFITNYPKSHKIMKENPNYQNNFK